MCDELSNREPGEFLLWRTAGESLYGTWFHGQPGAAMPADPGLSRAKALVHDAIRFLTRGEQVLYNRRRNVWWTTWFFQRKLMAVAMSVWATVPERGTPIPFLGLEAAPRKTPTMADAVLEDAIRMSRVDAYRLATIIDEYTSCACALHLRLMLDPGARRLPERQTAMTSSLAAAIARLAEVQLARQEWREDVSGKAGSREKVDKDAKVDKEIEDYIEAVIQRAKHRSRYLQNPLV
jgi:hypothetical protein